ncbi:PTS lactose/cellobiose transporter subunit IIA [Corticicoccus populi]|uniref:PTS lactose/cellobiose transporter subunit IIA n=1 Tax=Corticicoccus populi TaxID=1812821 RepID=A0ABW5WYM0_9STAP
MSAKEDLQMISFNIIAHAGAARSCCMEALQYGRTGHFEEASDKLKEADTEFIHAHNKQSALLHAEADGTDHQLSVILIHAQDHLMTAMTVKEMTEEMIEMYKRITKLEEIK